VDGLFSRSLGRFPRSVRSPHSGNDATALGFAIVPCRGGVVMNICHACGVEAATKEVTFYRHIGLVIVGLTKYISRPLCKQCIHKYFWEYTLVTGVFGWWGIISVFVTPFVLLNNSLVYLSCLSMEPPLPCVLPAYEDEARGWQ
jgi:hypothetical protein